MALVKRWYLKKMILCLWKTINGNQTYKYLEKKGRFNLEIQSGGHNNWKFVCNYFCWKEDRILFKVVFQIQWWVYTDGFTPDKLAGLYGTLIYNDSPTERKCSQCLNFEMPNRHLLKNNLHSASFKDNLPSWL